jgi:hypothetical protein
MKPVRPAGESGSVAKADFGDAVAGVKGGEAIKLLADGAGESGSVGGVLGAETISG